MNRSANVESAGITARNKEVDKIKARTKVIKLRPDKLRQRAGETDRQKDKVGSRGKERARGGVREKRR